jgi:hypothetical protein
MQLTDRQTRVFQDIEKDITLYLTRVIALPDFSTRLHDAIEELELDDKILLRSLLDCWTTLELIASTDDERNSLKEISKSLANLRALIPKS